MSRKQSGSSVLFRLAVLPSILLGTIFRTPLMETIAGGTVLIWLAVSAFGLAKNIKIPMKRRAPEKNMKRQEALPEETSVELNMEEGELTLLRQINYRITEQMKQTYPRVNWLWVKRPTVQEVTNGGVWRIRMANTDPFNFGEVEISKTGGMTITLLQAVPLNEAAERGIADDDLKPEEILDRTDCRTWYRENGQEKLSELIDELNTQGHKQLLIKEDGSIYIKSAGTEVQVDEVKKFPPRMIWEEFITLFSEDEIEAEIGPDGLFLSW